MIRTVRELLDEIKNQVGDHDESEMPLLIQIPPGTVPGDHAGVEYIEHFDGVLTIRVI
jgi:hypothetical protein